MLKLKSFIDAGRGILYAVRSQRHMKIHLAAVFVVLAGGLYLKCTATEWCLIALAAALVLGMETMNTAIEELVNMVSPEKREAAGRIKDIAAGAVLFAALGAAAVGIIILATRL